MHDRNTVIAIFFGNTILSIVYYLFINMTINPRVADLPWATELMPLGAAQRILFTNHNSLITSR